MAQKEYIYGKHAVAEAVRNAPHIISKVFISPSFDDRALVKEIGEKKIPTNPLKGNGPLGQDAPHQGLIALVDTDRLLVPLEKFLETIDIDKKPSVAILGELHDPHNVGAIIRSAAGFGVSAVLIPHERQAPITGTVVKTSAGMAFRIPLVSIGNINQTVRLLKEKGFWVYGLSGSGSQSLDKESFDVASAFIIGNEGHGIRQKTEELCDITLKIPMHSRTESFNASVSASVVFYEWAKHHKEFLA